jgi:multidrug efflux system membrane fusion protein
MIERQTEHKETASPTNGNGTLALPPAPERKELPPAPPPKRRRSWAWLWLLVLVGGGYAGFREYRNAQQKNAAAAVAQERRAANRTIPVSAVAARRGNLPIYLRGLGTVTPYNTVNVHTRVDGPITAVLFQEGQIVTKGQVLVEIDPRTFQAVVDQAQGQLARDQAQQKDAQVNLTRDQALWEAGVIAKQQLDTQASQVGQFQGSIEADKAAIESAQLQLTFTKVTAPIGGRIGLRQVDIGNIVHAADQNAIAVITQIQPIAVIFTIPADNLPQVLAKLRAGVTLPVEAWDRSDTNKIASGTLETVDNQIDPTTGTSRLKAIFQNENGALFPQQFVNARLLIETKRGVTLIPAPALQRGPQGAYVYLVDANGAAQMRPVATGATEGNDLEVTSGLASGAMVVVDGQDKLQEGSKVDIRPPDGAGRGGPAPPPPANVNPVATPNAGGVPAGRPAGGRKGGPPR